MKLQNINSNMSFQRIVVGDPNKQNKQTRTIQERLQNPEYGRTVNAHGLDVFIDGDEPRTYFLLKNANNVTVNCNEDLSKGLRFNSKGFRLTDVNNFKAVSNCNIWRNSKVENIELSGRSKIELSEITGDAIFNGHSRADQNTIHGNAVFNDKTSNSSKVLGDAVFNHRSENGYCSDVKGKATFNDVSVNRGQVNDAEFNYYSINYGKVQGKAVFNDRSENHKADSVSFTSRAPEIRYADQIMRKLLNEFPSIAPSKSKFYYVVRKKSGNMRKQNHASTVLLASRDQRRGLKPQEQLDKLVFQTKKNKIANCGELAELSRAAFIANGFKDVKVVCLKNKNTIKSAFVDRTTREDVDHAFLLVNGGKYARMDNPKSFNKKAFIVDPWSGFVDYVPSAFTRFEAKYMQGPKKFVTFIKECLTQKFVLEKVKLPYPTDATCRHYKELYPNLIVKKPTE